MTLARRSWRTDEVRQLFGLVPQKTVKRKVGWIHYIDYYIDYCSVRLGEYVCSGEA